MTSAALLIPGDPDKEERPLVAGNKVPYPWIIGGPAVGGERLMLKRFGLIWFALMMLLGLGFDATGFAKGRSGSSGAVHVQGYFRQNGTYVQPHYRSAPNGTTLDNYSTKGNINPFTGKLGTSVRPLPDDEKIVAPRSPRLTTTMRAPADKAH